MKTTVNENKNREFETPKLKLTAEHVKEIFFDCFLPEKYTDDTKVIPVKAVTGNFGFDPEKIEKHAVDIQQMISQLSSNFDEVNGGYTFMNLPFKGKNIEQWSENNEQWGGQIDGDRLMALGLASGWMKFTIEDKYLWQALPGGVPYVYRLDNRADISSMITTVGELVKNKEK